MRFDEHRWKYVLLLSIFLHLSLGSLNKKGAHFFLVHKKVRFPEGQLTSQWFSSQFLIKISKETKNLIFTHSKVLSGISKRNCHSRFLSYYLPNKVITSFCITFTNLSLSRNTMASICNVQFRFSSTWNRKRKFGMQLFPAFPLPRLGPTKTFQFSTGNRETKRKTTNSSAFGPNRKRRSESF